MNLYHDLPASPEDKDDEFHVVVDIPKGCSNKYEYDEDGGYFALDRVVHHQMFYPFDYGLMPQTHAEDGDAVDVCVLVTYPTFPGCVHTVRVLGHLDTEDESGIDPKIIAVPTTKKDPRWEEVKTVDDLPEHVRKELHMHFKELKHLEEKKYPHVKIGDWHGPDETLKLIEEAKEAYKKENAK